MTRLVKLCRVCFLGFIFGSLCDADDSNNFTLPEGFFYFPDLEAIKAFFRNDPDPLCQEILHTFEKECLYMEDPGLPTGRRKPFIVIEGNHRGSRNVIGMKLARRLNGRYLNNLAPCLHDHFQRLRQGTIARRVFYLLSIYASVFNAKVHLNLNRAVVLNGFWWEQITFSLLQALGSSSLPPVTASIFQSPPDLLQPDLLVFVDQPDPQWQPSYRSSELYQHLSQRHPIMFQRTVLGYKAAIEEVYSNIRLNLSDRLDFRYKADPYYE